MTLQLFKWMMALAVMLYLPLLFEQVKGFRRKDRKHSDEYIKERVESMWFDVTHFYNQLATSVPQVWPDFDRLYCSEAWNKCLAETDNHQMGNYWIGQGLQIPDNGLQIPDNEGQIPDNGLQIRDNGGQDNGRLGFLYVNKVEVIDRTGDQATVSLTLHNGNRSVPVLLVMVFEHDDWQIDDMTYYWNEKPSTRYLDWRQEMETLNNKQ